MSLFSRVSRALAMPPDPAREISRDIHGADIHGADIHGADIHGADIYGAEIFVALSGGRDSMALLHVVCRLRDVHGIKVRAVHVNHGLHADSAAWQEFCADRCAALDLPLIARSLDPGTLGGQSVEAWARAERYQVFAEILPAGGVLLTAHHMADQAETLLLQLLRGAGPHGLAAMPVRAPLGSGYLLRPWLDTEPGEIAAYAQRRALSWCEDPSNLDLRFDRNFLRHEIWPRLRVRWPGIDRNLARAARWQHQAAAVLDCQAKQDLELVETPDPRVIQIPPLNRISRQRGARLLRLWLAQVGLPPPAAKHISAIQNTLINARVDAQPCVTWPGACVRRYREALYARPPVLMPDPGFTAPWDLTRSLVLPWGTLSAREVRGRGISVHVLARGVVVRFRHGGERLRPTDRHHSQNLKRLFQEWGVVPWERDRTPLLYVDGKLIAVAGLCVCAGCGCAPDERGWILAWRPVT